MTFRQRIGFAQHLVEPPCEGRQRHGAPPISGDRRTVINSAS